MQLCRFVPLFCLNQPQNSSFTLPFLHVLLVCFWSRWETHHYYTFKQGMNGFTTITIRKGKEIIRTCTKDRHHDAWMHCFPKPFMHLLTQPICIVMFLALWRTEMSLRHDSLPSRSLYIQRLVRISAEISKLQRSKSWHANRMELREQFLTVCGWRH